MEGGYEDELLDLHRNAGIATAILSLIFFFLRRTAIYFFGDKGKRKWARIVLFSLLITLLSFTGHLGGSLTHGAAYLSFIEASSEDEQLRLGVSTPDQIDSVVLYTAVVEPILRSRCYSCHSASRQKGQLRLDQVTLIMKGGKHGDILFPGLPDSSEMYRRLLLPLEHDDHMPPNEKQQPTSAEIALIQVWIAEGADFEKIGGAYHARHNIGQYVSTLLAMNTRPALIPGEPVSGASPEAVSALRDRGAVVVPLGASSNYLSVTLINAADIDDTDLELLLPLADQLLWLDVSRTSITDAGLETIGALGNLISLNLSHTQITGLGIASLTSLEKLERLNLVGTDVSDEGLQSLAAIRSLRQLFIFNSQVTPQGVVSIRGKLPEVRIDTGGYVLPQLVSDTASLPGIDQD
jgi:hypothetical protein